MLLKIIALLCLPYITLSECTVKCGHLCDDYQSLSICEDAIEQYHVYVDILTDIARKSNMDAQTFQQMVLNMHNLVSYYNRYCRGSITVKCGDGDNCNSGYAHCISRPLYNDCMFLKQNSTWFNSQLTMIVPDNPIFDDTIKNYKLNIECDSSGSSSIYITSAVLTITIMTMIYLLF